MLRAIDQAKVDALNNGPGQKSKGRMVTYLHMHSHCGNVLADRHIRNAFPQNFHIHKIPSAKNISRCISLVILFRNVFRVALNQNILHEHKLSYV